MKRTTQINYFSGARSGGKSNLDDYYAFIAETQALKYRLVKTVTVGNIEWHSIICNVEVSEWLMLQPVELRQCVIGASSEWFSHFAVHEELYSFMALKWSQSGK